MEQPAIHSNASGPNAVRPATAFPMWAITVALLLTVGVFLFTGLSVYRSFGNYTKKLNTAFELQASVDRLNAAPTLTALARAVADTRDPQVRQDYAALAEELNRSLARIKALAPNHDIRLAADTLEQINQSLLDMERQAFDWVEQGRPEAAQTLLRSPEYMNRILEFDRFYQGLTSSARQRVESDLAALTHRAYLVLAINAATLPILLYVWFAVFRLVRRYLITQREFEEWLQDISLKDELTGLHNRRGFMTLASQQLKVADRSQEPLVLFFADIDNLKQINDKDGHPAGDRVLKETAGLLGRLVRESDILARIGGDEFVALLAGVDRAAAEHFIERLRDAERTRNEVHEKAALPLSLSVGYVVYNPADPCSLEDLIARADRYMYQKKRARKEPDSKDFHPAR